MNLKINFLENIQNIKSSTSDELLINIGHSIPAHIICKINKILRNNLFEQKQNLPKFLNKFIKGGQKIG